MIKIFDRLLLLFYSLVTGISAFYLLLLSFNWIRNDQIIDFMNNIQNVLGVQITTITIASIFFLISVRILYLTTRSSKPAPSIHQRNQIGDVRISVETVENLSLKIASRVKGTKDIKTIVEVKDAGLEIIIRTMVDGESSIPLITEEIQRTVKEQIQEISGIPVASVSVFVANVIQSQSFKSRVE